MAVLGLRCCVWLLAVASGGYSLAVVHGLIIEVASLVVAEALGSMGLP